MSPKEPFSTAGSRDRGEDAPERPDRPDRSLAERINHLFEVLHPAGRGPYSDREVEHWLAAHQPGPTISANYLRWLRRGERHNPTLENLRAIARFFDVDPGYLIGDESATEALTRDLELLALLRNHGVRGMAARAARMNDHELEWWGRMMDELRPRGAPPRTDPDES